MKQSLNELIGYRIEAEDGEKGTVKDILFDEDTWVLRYLKADLGKILPGKKVLIPQVFLHEPNWITHSFLVSLTTKQIENAPPIHDELTVSRKYEMELNKNYGLIDYWSALYIPPAGLLDNRFPERTLTPPNKIVNEKDLDTSLRSFNEVMGYHVKAIDGEMGHIDDLIIEDADWQIIYAVVDTKNWLPWSKKVLISIGNMEDISYVDRQVHINLEIETIKNAPEFNYTDPINEEYEKKLYDYYENVDVLEK